MHLKGKVWGVNEMKLYMYIRSIHTKLNSCNFQYNGVNWYSFPFCPNFGFPLCPKVNFQEKISDGQAIGKFQSH